jgi:vitamin B12 transporter
MTKTKDSHYTFLNSLYGKFVIPIGLVLIFAAPAFAQEAVDNIVVTGVRTTDTLEEVPNVTTVIRLEEIEARNKVSVADLLRNTPGIHVTQPSGQGGVARIFMRGGDQNLTMVLMDGIRVNDPVDSRGSAFDFSTVNMSDIERVEIVRGPQSAVYGSDALAGVINMITKAPADELGGSVFAEIGGDSYYQGSVDLSGPVGDSGGFSIRVATKDDGEPVTDTTFESDSITGRLYLGSSDSWLMKFVASYLESEGTAFPEDSGGADLAVLRTVDTRSSEDFRIGFNGSSTLSEKWALNILATWYDHDATFLSPGVAPGVRDGVPPNGGDANLQRADIAVNAVVSTSDELTITFGADYYEEDGVSDGFVEFGPGFQVPSGFQFDRSVVGAFGELHYKTKSGPVFMASLRHDEPNEESGETTGKIGFLYDLSDGQTSIRANWGQGFSLPGFFALASPLVGNPDLLPETSESFDIGISRWSPDKTVGATLTYFQSVYDDLIDFDSATFQMVNRDELQSDGVEMQLDFAVSESFEIIAQATYMDLEFKNSDLLVRQRPEWRGGLMMNWAPSQKWLVDVAWLYVGETFDSSIPTGDMIIDGHNRLDATITLKQSEKLSLLLSVDNLLDAEYEEAIGFPSPGIRARLGVRARF